MERLFDHIRLLTELPGVSGDEGPVRAGILSLIEGHYESATVDPLGNLIVVKKGKKTPQKTLMAAAHMDEVGLMVSGITDGGLLLFVPVGGLDPRVLMGKRVKLAKSGHSGLIGYTSIHLMDERGEMPKLQEMRIDIGAKDRASAEKLVNIGDTVVFDSDYILFGNDKMKAKALDDRAGCAILVELILGEIAFDTTFVFTVQEEVGCRGAITGAYTVNPDYAVVAEATTAADLDGVPGEKTVCTQGGGAVISLMDRTTVYDRALVAECLALAKEKNIKVQVKRSTSGGNDSGSIHPSRGGTKVLAVSLPCRYIHSPASMVEKSDVVASYQMVAALLEMCGEKSE